MKKLFLVLFLFAFASFLLVGCTPEIPCTGPEVVNGGFETCDFSGWDTTVSDQFPQAQNIEVYSGSCAAYMGDGAGGLHNGITNTASIQQIVYIPACAVNPLLTLNYRVDGTDSAGEGWDWMKVYINGTEILDVWSDTGGWQQFQYNLSAFTDTSIILKISAWTIDSVSAVYYYVDNVSITWD
jgi:hypothetical protein